jgi:flagellar hook-basal body complex protein FliE
MSVAPITAPITPTPVASPSGVERIPQPGGDLGESFGKALVDARALDQQATAAAEKFASGDPAMGIHEVVIATEKASIALRYATTLKNKALEAYHELINTQV